MPTRCGTARRCARRACGWTAWCGSTRRRAATRRCRSSTWRSSRVRHDRAHRAGPLTRTAMQLAAFIAANIEPILRDWVAFARTRIPVAGGMTELALRNDAADILAEIAHDMLRP